ncbi:MAG: hypothetical protein QM784_04440 [Polyangiaceae bacterium]
MPAKAIRERVSTLLELIQLEGYAERMPHETLRGQRQRVALARALAPRTVVCCSSTNPSARSTLGCASSSASGCTRLHEKTQDVTTLLVTHDQEEALELSEHVVLLSPTVESNKRAPPRSSIIVQAKIARGIILRVEPKCCAAPYEKDERSSSSAPSVRPPRSP